MDKRKYSARREAILNLLRSTTIHPGAQWIYKQLKHQIPRLSPGTVYRNLNILRKERMAVSLGVIRGEERFDGITKPHPHLICSSCGVVINLPFDTADVLVKHCKELSVDDSFLIDFRQTVFYGLCSACQKNQCGDPEAA
ncbi:MAG: transcriptional repressor [Treponema sp.]|jgi:Fur family peroxide stress response transcriptional regulator|nr:transcriptional repressor [Treponema sp.]